MPDLPEKRQNVPQGIEETKAAFGTPEETTSLGVESGVHGERNTFFGTGSGKEASGKENVGVGWHAGNELGAGAQNTILGATAGREDSTGNKNVYVGFGAGNQTTGSSNVFIGCTAGESEVGASNTLLIANNGTTAIIKGVMSATAASNELGLGTTGGKIGFLAAAAAPVVAKAAGAETTAAIWERLKELGLTT